MRPPRSLPEGSVERLEQALQGTRSKAEFQRVQCGWLRPALRLNSNQVAQALGMAAEFGTAAAGAVLAAGRRVLGASGAGWPTPPEPDTGRRGTPPAEFSFVG